MQEVRYVRGRPPSNPVRRSRPPSAVVASPSSPPRLPPSSASRALRLHTAQAFVRPGSSRGCKSAWKLRPRRSRVEPTPDGDAERRPSRGVAWEGGREGAGGRVSPDFCPHGAPSRRPVSLRAGRQDDRRPYRAHHATHSRGNRRDRPACRDRHRRAAARGRTRLKRAGYDQPSIVHAATIYPEHVDSGVTSETRGRYIPCWLPYPAAAGARATARCWTSRAAGPPPRNSHAPRHSPTYRCCSPVRDV